MITSAIDGRIRIVDPMLRQKHLADAVTRQLEEISIVDSAVVNPLTGSLLIHYQGSKARCREVCKAANRQLKALRHNGALHWLQQRKARKYVKFTMLGGLTSSMMTLLLGSEKWHFWLGSLFLSGLSVHFWQNRRTLLK